MRIKTVSAPNIKVALQRIRMLLGDDATILSNRKVGKGVEVMASYDPQVTSKLKIKPNHPINILNKLSNICDFHRIPDVLRDRWLEIAKNETSQQEQKVSASLSRIMDVNNLWVNQLSEQDSIVFVGPPGAGKTVSLAKVAIAARLRRMQFQTVTLDVFKAGGYQQLQEYMNVLKLTVLPLDSIEKLQEVVVTGGLKLIDMPGINILDQQDVQFANEVIKQTSAVPILVLPAGLDALTSAELAYEYIKLGVRGVIFTQLDTARRYGSLITVPSGCNLPLIGLNHTPSIGEDLQLPSYSYVSKILEATVQESSNV